MPPSLEFCRLATIGRRRMKFVIWTDRNRYDCVVRVVIPKIGRVGAVLVFHHALQHRAHPLADSFNSVYFSQEIRI